MLTETEALTLTWRWLIVYGVSIVIFFGIAVWVIFQGGRDVLEILSIGKKRKE